MSTTKYCDVCGRIDDGNMRIYSHKMKKEGGIFEGGWIDVDICEQCRNDLRNMHKRNNEIRSAIARNGDSKLPGTEIALTVKFKPCDNRAYLDKVNELLDNIQATVEEECGCKIVVSSSKPRLEKHL